MIVLSLVVEVEMGDQNILLFLLPLLHDTDEYTLHLVYNLHKNISESVLLSPPPPFSHLTGVDGNTDEPVVHTSCRVGTSQDVLHLKIQTIFAF